MADLTIQEVPVGGLASVTQEASAAAQTIPANPGNRRQGGYDLATLALICFNTNAATRDVTVEGLSAVTVPALTGVSVIPIPDGGVNPGQKTVTYSATAGLNVALVRLGKGY